MQNFNVELFSRLFFLNLAKTFKIDENFSIIADQASPSASGQSNLEPPTPPRTPIIAAHRNKSAEKHYNNNNDDAKENFEGNSSNTPSMFKPKSESDFDEFPQRYHHDDSNYSDEDRGGRESVTQINGTGDESDHEESDCASSFDSSKLSMKNIENFLDKSPMVSFLQFSKRQLN